MNNNIGIIGQGFVGTATSEGLKEHFQVYTYDKFLDKNLIVLTCYKFANMLKLFLFASPRL